MARNFAILHILNFVWSSLNNCNFFRTNENNNNEEILINCVHKITLKHRQFMVSGKEYVTSSSRIYLQNKTRVIYTNNALLPWVRNDQRCLSNNIYRAIVAKFLALDKCVNKSTRICTTVVFRRSFRRPWFGSNSEP